MAQAAVSGLANAGITNYTWLLASLVIALVALVSASWLSSQVFALAIRSIDSSVQLQSRAFMLLVFVLIATTGMFASVLLGSEGF